MEGDLDIIQLLLYGFGPSVVTILLVDVKCFLYRHETSYPWGAA
jgi:hypothetical protein